jgi:hypothetical protein
MAKPIAATPVLTGREANEFIIRMHKEASNKVGLSPTLKLENANKLIEQYSSKKGINMIENIEQMRKRHEKEIAKLQRLCEHTKCHEARYMWAMGHFDGYCEVCDWCGKILSRYNTSKIVKG